MTRKPAVILCILGSCLVQLIVAASAHAIPAFTRANKVECSTCHTIYPELNEYGEAFLKNSYVYFGKGQKSAKEKDAIPAAAPAAKPDAAVGGKKEVRGETGADSSNELKAGEISDIPATPAAEPAMDAAAPAGGERKLEGLLLAAIPEQLPISFTASIDAAYNHKAANELDLSTRVLKLNAGGNFSEKAAFFATFTAYSQGNTDTSTNTTSTLPSNNSSNINELFFIWRHALDTPINIKVGRMQPKLSLWKSTNKLAVTNSFAPYSYTVGVSEFTLEQPQDALEANAVLGKRFYIAAGVVNRKNQNAKEGYGHISYKIGGADYLANEPEVDLAKEESVLDFLTTTIGAYGYYGTNGTPNTTPGLTPIQNHYYRTGVDLDILYKLFRLRMAGIIGNDDNAFLSSVSATEVKSYVAAIEAEYAFLSNLIGAFRYEYQDDGRGIVHRYIPTLAYTPLQNVKVAMEYKHEVASSYKTTETSAAQDFTNRIGTLSLTFSF